MTTPRFTVQTGNQPEVELIDARLGFKAGYICEVIDERTGETVDDGVVVFALNPKSYNLSEPFAVTLTPTEGDAVTAEENGQIIREITVEGTFGFSEKRIPQFTSSQGGIIGGGSRSGNQHFIALRQLFRRYSTLKKDPASGPFIRMIWHALKDDDHFIVIPRSFETPRDSGQTRLTYNYRITMAVIGDSDRRIRLREDSRGGFLKTVSNALNDARATFADLTSNLSALKRKVGNIQSVLIQAGAVISAVSNTLRSGADLIQFSFKQAVNAIDAVADATDTLGDAITDSTFGTLGTLYRDMRRFEAALNRIVQFPEKFEDAATDYVRLTRTYDGEAKIDQDDLDNRTAGVSAGTRLRIAAGLVSESGLDLGDFRGFKSREVAATDSVESLAAEEGVPAEAIVVVNDLRFPYITEGGGPGLLGYGEKILIPLTRRAGGDDDNTTGAGGYLSADEVLYGRDIALDAKVLADERKFEWAVDIAHGAEREATIAGIPNLVQGITLIIGQERSSNAYVPNVGIRRTAGLKGTIQGVLLASINLREAILADPRIEDIAETQVVLEGDVLQQEITPIVRGRKDGATFVLPVGQVSGE